MAIIFTVSPLSAQSPAGEGGEERGDTAIRVAYCNDCVPFHFRNEQGNPDGLIIDLWNLWSKKSGQPIHFIPYTWDETIKKVASGEADAHAGLFFNYVESGLFGH
ncbi:MAG: transporter substrate-binding domain-containing protein [Magnetococcales bacterium]|nr:transporter substrate-binding domain-containing protein [Magnetococcales bacterium]